MSALDVETPRGPARVTVDRPAGSPALLLALGHGAGGGIEAPDLLAVRDAGLALGAVVARVEQPYRVAGRRAPAPGAHLDAAWAAVMAVLRAEHPGTPLITGGRSSGARVACRTAREVDALGVLALAFPLHPPGKPDRTRAPELAAAGRPVLVINGSRDPFGVPEPAPLITVRVIEGADHSLRRDPGEVARLAGEWLRRVAGRAG